jgi:fatty acyl-CoA reductase
MGRETFDGKRGLDGRLSGATVLLTGASGFLGKAVLACLLEHAPGTRRVMVLLRAEDEAGARRRLEEEVLGADAFAGLSPDSRRRLLDSGTLRAVAGDVERIEPVADTEGWSAIDTVIHCAASVSFEDPIDDILPLNALGPVRLLESLAEAGAEPHFVHVSTAYAADSRGERATEDESHPGLPGLDPEEMLATSREWREAVERESHGSSVSRHFTREAGRDAAHRPGMDAIERAEELRRRWVRKELGRRGRRRAMDGGWQDTYAMTKALGERLLKERTTQLTIVRPSIIESALRRPRPGWLEGIKVADPLILAYAARGLTDLPGRATNLIDIVPVDHVANACVAAAAYPPAPGEGPRTISATTGAANPLQIGRLAEHIKAHFRREPLRRRSGAPIEIGDLRFVDRRPALRHTIRREMLVRAAARAARLAPAATGAEKNLRRNAALAAQVTRMVKIYGPYTELDCVFDDANARRLESSMTAGDRATLSFDPTDFDWTDYLEGIHLPEVHRMYEAGARSG